MELKNELFREHSRANAVRIADWIGADTSRFDGLMQLFLHGTYREVQRAAHIISIVGDHHPHLLAPHLAAMVKHMQQTGQPVAVKRNVVRVLQHLDIPEALHGDVMNACFDLLANVKETIAVRAFSMTVLARLATYYPDIKPELRTLIEDGLEQDPSPGFKNRALKVLAGL